VISILAAAGLLGTASSSRSAIQALPSLPPVNTIPPTIAGSAVAGATVQCSQGQWLDGPTSYEYSWLRNATTTLSGPSASNGYTLTSADTDQVITCEVTAVNAAGSASAISLPITPAAAPVTTVPVNESPPSISGNAKEGDTVACLPGTWLNSPTEYTYTWQRDASNIAGQASTQYTLTSADVDRAITCTVVASNGQGSGVRAVSLPVIPSTASSSGGSGGSGGGSSAGGTSSGGGSGAGGGGDPTPSAKGSGARVPVVRSFSASPRRMVITVEGTHQRTNGETLSYGLAQAATVRILVERQLTGRVAGKRCVAATRRTSRARRCTRYSVVTTMTVKSAKAGNSHVHYTGRVAQRLLPNGNYRVLLDARDAAGWSKTRSASFAVVRMQTHPV
jgi:uncharacterized membrane protein YgcG